MSPHDDVKGPFAGKIPGNWRVNGVSWDAARLAALVKPGTPVHFK